MSQEARTIRPFSGLGEVTAIFDDSLMFFGTDHCGANESISLVIDPDEYCRRPVVLQWAPEEEFELFTDRLQAIPDATGTPPEALTLFVLASTAYLKKTEVLVATPLSALDALGYKQSLSDGERPAPFMAGHHGSTVDLYLALNQEIAQRPLRPWRKGTWLAHAKFGLLTTIASSMFRPTPLTNDTRDQIGLDGRTVRYFDLGDHDLLERYDDQGEEPTFYVDDQLLAELSANANSSASKTMQLQLALDFMTAVINEASRRRDELDAISYSDIEDSLLGRVLRVAAGPGARLSDKQALFSRVRSEPAKAIARAEHTVDIQKVLAGVFHGDDS